MYNYWVSDADLEFVIDEYDLAGTPIEECEPRPAIVVTDKIYLNEGGELHREDGPALTRVRSDYPDLVSEFWFKNGVPHRVDGPSASHYKFDSGGIRHITEYMRDDDPFREDGPSYIERDAQTGIPIRIAWDGPHGLHRPKTSMEEPQNPALIVFDRSTGTPVEIEYRVNHELHRPAEEGPARIVKSADTGQLKGVAFFRNGVRHRDSGPAILTYDPLTGEVTGVGYFKNGVPVDVPVSSATADQLTSEFTG